MPQSDVDQFPMRIKLTHRPDGHRLDKPIIFDMCVMPHNIILELVSGKPLDLSQNIEITAPTDGLVNVLVDNGKVANQFGFEYEEE